MRYYSINQIEDVAEEPITLEEAKTHLRLVQSPEITTFDSTITQLITSARMSVENEIHRPIGLQKFELGLRYFPDSVQFPYPPLIDVLKIAYKSVGVWTVIHDTSATPPILSDVFQVDNSGDPGELWMTPGGAGWPSAVVDTGFPVRIQYSAGITTLPEPLRNAMLLQIGTLFENRESLVLGQDAQAYELTEVVERLTRNYVFEEFA